MTRVRGHAAVDDQLDPDDDRPATAPDEEPAGSDLEPVELRDDARIRLANRWGVSTGAVVFLLVLFDFGIDPFRTALRARYFSNFFDVQAEAFLRGHLNVPTGILGIEGFVIDGKTYEYFPPFPALLRMPLMLITHEFDGRLTLLSMGLGWVLFSAMAVRLFWLVRHCLRGDLPVGRTEAIIAACLIATATGGTTLTYDAALPWVYHEVYVWECAFVVAALYWVLRLSLDPTRAGVGWLAAANAGAIMTRTPGGAATCLVSLGLAAWLVRGRLHAGRRRLAWLVAAAAVVPLALSVTYNMIKFGHPYLFPLQDQVWTSVNARRREALARNGGTITGPQFLATTTVNYLRPDGIRFTGYFPYVTLPARPAAAHGGAFLDQSYRTGSATAFMPLLFLTGMWGVVVTFARRRPFAVRALRLPLLGAALVPSAILVYGYIAQRYVSEFVPFVVVGGFIGGIDLARRVSRHRSRSVKAVLLSVVAALAAFGMMANALIGYTTAQLTWGGDKLEQYVGIQRSLSALTGHPLAAHTYHVDALPARAATDDLYMVGDCAGLYLSTGDRYQPWAVVEQRLQRARLVVRSAPRRLSTLALFRVESVTASTVSVQTRAGRLRIVVQRAGSTTYGRWISAAPGDEIDLTMQPRTDLGLVEVSTVPGGHVAWVPFVEWTRNWDNVIGRVERSTPDVDRATLAGLRVIAGATARPALCRQVAGDAGIVLRR